MPLATGAPKKPGLDRVKTFFGHGALCAPSPKSQHIFKTPLSLELLFCDFSFCVFSIQKCLVPPISPHVCFQGNHTTFDLNLKTRISIVFQVFPPERNFLWNNLLCFGYHNTLRSLIETNIRSILWKHSRESFAQLSLMTLN